MIKRINQHLLTHYPLVWNTRLVWTLTTAFMMHLLYFLAGFSAPAASQFKYHYTSWSIGGENLMIFSILFSIVFVITWLVYYLRNNAFKQFYIIDKWHLAKEFLAIFIIILSATTFFESFNFGLRTRVQQITSTSKFAEEANTINIAAAFITTSKEEYFILNNCNKNEYELQEGAAATVQDSTSLNFNDSANRAIRAALLLPNAYSYLNYCRQMIDAEFEGLRSRQQNFDIKNTWINAGNKDSITQVLEAAKKICAKYAVLCNYNSRELTDWVFNDSLHSVTNSVATQEYYTNDAGQHRNTNYVEIYQLRQVFDFMESCFVLSRPSRFAEGWMIEIYVALSLSIILLAYRRFSRKVFLISVIGAIVWVIIITLFGVTGGADRYGIPVFCIFLFALFTLIPIINFKNRQGKLVAGVALNWQLVLLPMVPMFIVWLISGYYHDMTLPYTSYYDHIVFKAGPPVNYRTEAQLAQMFPISYWVQNNTVLLAWINIFISILYIIFIYNRFTRKWHELPDE